jgi:hypothetical protein
MQTKTHNRTATPGIRKGTARRSKEQDPIRERREGAEGITEVIADSIFALTLSPKVGAEVFFKLGGSEPVTHKGNEAMYNDLYASFENLYMQMTGQETRDTYKLGISLHVAFDHVIQQLKLLLPSGYEFNIEYDEHCQNVQKYYFVIYHECVWQNWWHHLEVGKALLKLAKCNKPLHDLFLSFLKALGKCGVCFWDEGFMTCTFDYMDGLYYDLKGSDEKEQAKQVAADIKTYTTGIASKYRKLIAKAPVLAVDDMQKRARRFKNDSEIANIIHQGCELIRPGYRIRDYEYLPISNEDCDYFLELDSQCNIIWDSSDSYTAEHMEMLDNTANNGYVQEPVCSIKIEADTKNIDLPAMAMAARWPIELVNFFSRASELIDTYIA